MKPFGDYIAGSFHSPEGEVLISRNPARDGAVVLETATSPDRIGQACAAAADASAAWAALTVEERYELLLPLRDALAAQRDELAEAITLETGKLRSEARGEANALVSRFELVRDVVEKDLKGGPLPGRPNEQLRFHPLGVVGVIGPFNYPLHLCHAHLLPALLMGNTVVVKPSEVTPLAAQRYAKAVDAAGLPSGILNVVHGTGASGAALVGNANVRGLCFTGSYHVGKMILTQALERPELLVALEMGGKNTVVVLDDADLRQAAHEIVVGGYLTTGQRCTATDRVLVHKNVAPRLLEALRPMVEALRFGDPDDTNNFAGPLATESGRDTFETAVAAAREGGAEALVPGGRLDGGFFAGPSLHRLPDGKHDIAGYTDAEVFGPDIAVELVGDDDEAIAVLRNSPYGLANSIFTANSARFERFYRETRSGILNSNRSTNLASPRLPFGGVGRSGNYRPAGSYAPRNVVVPMAVQENVLGSVQVHPMLADHMPAPDLDFLAERHAQEEALEATRNLFEQPRPMALRRPAGGRLPKSAAQLIRLYAGERVVREKKPAVFDHLRSSGPWFVSIDDEPLSVLDGMSQTATLCGGFAEDPVVRAYVEGGFQSTIAQNIDTSGRETDAARDYATELRQMVQGLPHVTFVNSGAEANEKALALCKLNSPNPAATKVLAFEGSFHGRTLYALHATYNPAKRTPFEIPGYEATFAPFPVWENPHEEEPAAPAGFYAAAAHADLSELVRRFGNKDEAPLLAAEVDSLMAVHAALSTGDYYACVIEPMQSEGGDRYASARFFRALRLLTRHHSVALIFDEVQTGFGLGGPFVWHELFRLVNKRGRPDFPDAVVFAKRAQCGVVMSQWPDPEQTSAHNASLVRGRLHAEMMALTHDAERIEKLVHPTLMGLADAFPHLVKNPRGRGYAFAFDLPSPQHVKAYIGQRFWRGAVVFGAGSLTVRYRLNSGFYAREVQQLMEMVRRSLSWLDAHPNAPAPAWEDEVRPAKEKRERVEYRVRNVGPEEAVKLLPAILDIEYQIYEPVRRTPPVHIRAALADAEGIITIAEVPDGNQWRFVAFGIGAPLEHSRDVEEGPDQDVMLGRNNTLYSVSLTVSEGYQGIGIGRAIKMEQLREASRRRTADGKPRFRYVTSRNRIGHTANMRHLNRVLGAHSVCVLTGQYLDPEGQAIYNRIALPPFAPAQAQAQDTAAEQIELSEGVARPFAKPPASLVKSIDEGLLYGPVVNKLTLLNYVTPAVVRAFEWVGALIPELPHMYLTSGRDEMLDKSLRILRWHRSEACVAIGLDGGYVGHTTAAARSVSDPRVHRQGDVVFDWPRIPHPAVVGTDASIAALRRTIERAGRDKVFGFLYEVVQERTGRVLPDDFFVELAKLRAEMDLPVVAFETASACYRAGAGPFATTTSEFTPDMLLWWGGAQTGYMHVSSRYFVAKPLTMVSTWDGDELSMIREHHQLRTARSVDTTAAIKGLDELLERAAQNGIDSSGLGLYRVINAGERADELVSRLEAAGFRVRRFANDCLSISPAFDQLDDVLTRLDRALNEAG